MLHRNDGMTCYETLVSVRLDSSICAWLNCRRGAHRTITWRSKMSKTRLVTCPIQKLSLGSLDNLRSELVSATVKARQLTFKLPGLEAPESQAT